MSSRRPRRRSSPAQRKSRAEICSTAGPLLSPSFQARDGQDNAGAQQTRSSVSAARRPTRNDRTRQTRPPSPGERRQFGRRGMRSRLVSHTGGTLVQPLFGYREGAVGLESTEEKADRAAMVVTITIIARLHVMMVVMHGLFTDHSAVFVGVNLPVMMVVMNHVRIAVTIDLSHAVVVVVMSAHGRRGGNKRSGCQSTKDCLFHVSLGEPA